MNISSRLRAQAGPLFRWRAKKANQESLSSRWFATKANWRDSALDNVHEEASMQAPHYTRRSKRDK